MARRTTKDPRERALEQALEQGTRVRVLIGDRRTRLPGALVRADDGHFVLRANWGKDYPLPTDAELKEVEIADERGRYQPIAA